MLCWGVGDAVVVEGEKRGCRGSRNRGRVLDALRHEADGGKRGKRARFHFQTSAPSHYDQCDFNSRGMIPGHCHSEFTVKRVWHFC